MLIWLQDAPKLFNDSSLHDTRVCEFIDNVITCERGWDGSPHTYNAESTEESWDAIIRRQTHKHKFSCRRNRGGQTVCRFNIPFMPMDVTRVLRPLGEEDNEAELELSEQQMIAFRVKYKEIRAYLNENTDTLVESSTTFDEFLQLIQVTSVGEYILCIRSSLKTTKVFLRRAPNEIMTNSYNQKILSMSRSKMDLQFIVDAYACSSYVADYINKADKGISRTLKDIYEAQRRNPSADAFQTLRSIATSYYNSSEISAQEAAYNLLRIRMSEASTVCVHIPTSPPDKRLHIVRSDLELEEMDRASTDCFKPGLVKHYINRPA